MKITFILPCPSWLPIGGFKVVYEYANRLTLRGHRVTVIHPHFIAGTNVSRLKSMLVTVNYVKHILKKSIKRPWYWFKKHPGVRMKLSPNLKPIWVPDADVIVATLWNTAESIAPLPARKGRKVYFIQGLDTVFNQTTPSRAMNTWKFPYYKIVISRWLEQIARNRGESCTYIPNAINFNEFTVEVPIDKRNAKTVCLINSGDIFKGTSDGLKALRIVKEKVPDVSVIMFGVGPEPDIFPLRVRYCQNPTIHQIKNIFNESSIFIGTSWCEGFGLPPCEAAACGAALCVAENGGHREFAVHDKTALMHPPKRSDILAANILCLLNDNEKRIRIAREGNSFINQFSWDRSVEIFEQTLRQAACR
jgi:glycosyltransferase involved in cell wall biosynthesis